jgi:hypothetical protein
MREEPESLTYTVLVKASTAMPVGLENCAAVPMPSAKPPAPLPAWVITEPTGETTLILWLLVSDTYMRPKASRAIPVGKRKDAVLPCPSK